MRATFIGANTVSEKSCHKRTNFTRLPLFFPNAFSLQTFVEGLWNAILCNLKCPSWQKKNPTDIIIHHLALKLVLTCTFEVHLGISYSKKSLLLQQKHLQCVSFENFTTNQVIFLLLWKSWSSLL